MLHILVLREAVIKTNQSCVRSHMTIYELIFFFCIDISTTFLSYHVVSLILLEGCKASFNYKIHNLFPQRLEAA